MGELENFLIFTFTKYESMITVKCKITSKWHSTHLLSIYIYSWCSFIMTERVSYTFSKGDLINSDLPGQDLYGCNIYIKSVMAFLAHCNICSKFKHLWLLVYDNFNNISKTSSINIEMATFSFISAERWCEPVYRVSRPY